MSFTVKTKMADELEQDEREHLGMGTPCRFDFDTFIVVRHNGAILFIESDGGEPEDMSFGRDLSWIPGAIEDAYYRGRQDGVYEGGC